MGAVSMEGFAPRTIDKVERLLDLMEETERHPNLKGKLAMHGGTAINLFMLDAPRLSVDIDLSYVGAVDRDEMLAERPRIERGIEEVARYLGYDVPPTKSEHAGRAFILRYRGDWGPDHVKIDCNFLNRSLLMVPASRPCVIRPDAQVVTFSDTELVGSKVKALFDRVEIRDLYDVCSLEGILINPDEEYETLIHRVILYYASLSARFPQPFEGRTERFADKEAELKSQLLPMLRAVDERPTLQKLIASAEQFIERRVLPRTDSERKYLELFAAGDYRPALLFPDTRMAATAEQSPAALWKLQNLKRVKG